jgi:RimJ/RimL family protein N-acetyltransferase
MLEFVIHEHVHIKRRTLGLLVDEDNPNAERLYLRAGFEPEGLRSLAGKKMKHLQIKQDKEP